MQGKLKYRQESMMFKSHFGETVTVVLAIVMGIIMALASIFVEHLDFNFSN